MSLFSPEFYAAKRATSVAQESNTTATSVKQESNTTEAGVQKKRVQFNLPTTLVDKLTQFCAQPKQLQSTVVELAIAQYLASQESK